MGILRLLLALSVAYGHAGLFLGFPLLPGDSAVQAFYAISGFYMALVLNERYRPENSTYWTFIGNRFTRLLPAYLVVLLATLVDAAILSWRGIELPFVEFWRSLPDLGVTELTYLIGSQIVLIGQDLYMFLTVQHGSLQWIGDFHDDPRPLLLLLLIPPAWTLGIEMWFYLVAPFIVRRPFAAVAALLFASVALRMLLQFGYGHAGDPWSYRFFPSELALFLCGALGYRVYRTFEDRGKRSLFGLFALACVTVAVALVINRWNGLSRLVSVAALLALLLAIPLLFRMTRHNAFDRIIGEMSYPLYICHFLVIWTFNSLTSLSGVSRGLGIIVTALALSWLLYWLIDRPIDAWRHAWFAPRPTAGASARLAGSGGDAILHTTNPNVGNPIHDQKA